MNLIKYISMKSAIDVLVGGGLIIFPTDTAFGLGCRIDSKEAVERLFSVKQRPLSQAVPVLTDSVQMAKSYIKNIPRSAAPFVKKYWPGALTIVVPCRKENVHPFIRGNGNTIGLRVPDHMIILELIHGVGVPVLGPSANIHGEKTPFTLEDIDIDLAQKTDGVLPGECLGRLPSTVIDCTVKPIKILRRGAIKIDL